VDFQNLTTAERQAILRATVLENPYIPHEPTLKQAEFLLNFKPEVLFGGAAGGGKSDALLMAALQFVEVPGYAALVLRTSYTDLILPDGLIPRSHEWLSDTDARWRENAHQWQFPSGATITFGFLSGPNDIYRYKSSAYQFVGFEELTEFPRESDYAYLFSRIRRLKGAFVPTRMRSATNPDGVGADWVYDRFQPDHPELRDPLRSFIPSKLDDNPHIDQEEYDRNLGFLDPVTRLQLRQGRWKVVKEGNLFKREWFTYCEPNEVPAGSSVRYWDFAATAPTKKGSTDPDFTVGAKVKLAAGKYYVEDIVRARIAPGDVEPLVKTTAEMDGKGTYVYIEQEPGASGKIVVHDYTHRVLLGYPVVADPVRDPKHIRAQLFSAACFNRQVVLVRSAWNRDLVEECVAFPNPLIHDDQVDAVSGAISKLPRLTWLAGDTREIAMGGGDLGSSPGDLDLDDVL